ncbi:DUF459 domain-containing protein [Rhizobium rosettiformans]|uniref:DUF459 domain-containing protein n=1 Tax=Rhizobium rosettiformans TaxID=1368430 RepID=A0ABX7ES29_9HYPH|nr:DUF459 domain-containing protein [Rhizobium rosettiformans]QRF50132.1 DUF459 domain-containing protein [Rhizobium rosettiformans]
MTSPRGTFARLMTLGLALTVVATAFITTSAEAQQPERRRTLLDLLFGERQPAYVPPQNVQRPRETNTRKKTSGSVTTINTRPQSTRAVAAPPPPPKLDNAKTVLVLGDFVASALGDGLKTAFEDSPGVVVENRTNGSSGLVRDDFYDWPGQLPALVSDVKPSVVVIQIGANDRQQLVTPTGRLDFRTDPWFAAYSDRVARLASVAAETRVPVIWVGLPAFRPQNMTADALRLNTIYRSSIEKVNGEFVDIWEGFVDQEGRFIVTGSDINGQPVRLRGNDGIGFTGPGKRKLAFYVEKSVRRYLGDMTSPDIVRLDASNLPELVTLSPSENKAIVTTPPIDLFDPELDGADELLGGTVPASSTFLTPRDQLVKNGRLPDPPVGRVDYVKRQAEVAPTASPAPTTATP